MHGLSEKKEEEKKDIAETVADDEDTLFQDDPKDLNYHPPSQRYTLCQVHRLTPCTECEILSQMICCFAFSGAEEEEGLSSDEDVPFRDDLNDQSYNPKGERFVCLYLS